MTLAPRTFVLSRLKGTEPSVRKGKRSLLATFNFYIRRKCSIENTRNSVTAKLDIQVMIFVESLIGWEVTVTGRRSECHLAFVRGILHIAEKDPRVDHNTS